MSNIDENNRLTSRDRLSWKGLTYNDVKKRTYDRNDLIFFAFADIDENQVLDEFEIRRQELQYQYQELSEIELHEKVLHKMQKQKRCTSKEDKAMIAKYQKQLQELKAGKKFQRSDLYKEEFEEMARQHSIHIDKIMAKRAGLIPNATYHNISARQGNSIKDAKNNPDNNTILKRLKITGHSFAKNNMKKFYYALNGYYRCSLMKTLNLTLDEYERLINIALGIAEQETHFGDKTFDNPLKEEHWQKRILVKNLMAKLPISCSKGLTQIKWKSNFQDGSKNKEIAAKYGIFSDNDYNEDPVKCAIATMIILAGHLRTAESDLWQNRIAKNNTKISNPKEQIKTDDIIALLWNGTGLVDERLDDENDIVKISDENTSSDWLIQMHLKSKDGMSYPRYVRYYREKYFSGKIQ